MRFPSPLERGRLLRRYKRFLADVVLDGGETVTAACPNTGAMLGLCSPGLPVWLSTSPNPQRKYPRTWEMVEAGLGAGAHFVGINTGRPNAIVAEAIAAGSILELAGYENLVREVRYGKASRIDILLSDSAGRRVYVEVKNAHMMRRSGLAEFPDCVTLRGRKHLADLSAMAEEGHRAVMVFLVQRSDAEAFEIARDIDPAYGAALDRARSAGVEALVYRCRLSPEDIVLDRAIPMRGTRRVTKTRSSP